MIDDSGIEALMRGRLDLMGIPLDDLEPIAPAIATLLQGVATIGDAIGDVPNGRVALAVILESCSDVLRAEAGMVVICPACHRSLLPTSPGDLPGRLTTTQAHELAARMLPFHSNMDARPCSGSGAEPLAVTA
jgi:hypothetical protein